MSNGKPTVRPGWIGGVVVVLVVLAAWFFWPGAASDDSLTASPSSPAARATGSSSVDPETGLRWVGLAALPSQAQQTVALIEAGGPYPYSRDGIVFGNREGLLPQEKSGWYHEYTVLTPGSSDRGARRIVTGGASGATVGHGLEFFYSDDHYDSFRRVRVDS